MPRRVLHVRQLAQVLLKVRSPLRELTSGEHAAVDRIYSTFDLSSLAGYRSFLSAQAQAYLPAEAAISGATFNPLGDWTERRRSAFLRQDMADLGLVARHAPAAPMNTQAELLGSVYVLEGSRLGGALLARTVVNGAPTRFLNAASRAGAWRDLLIILGEQLDRPAKVEAAASAARQVFRSFEQAARAELEFSGGN